MARKRSVDIEVMPRGSITFLHFKSRRARAWARENVPDYGHGQILLPCEPRMAWDICEGMVVDGIGRGVVM
jgi:hypothetical protein